MNKISLTAQHLIILLCALLITLAYTYQVCNYWHYTNDDAYITFRYSQNLASGNGPYFNIGEHVEGYTNFSLMILMAFAVYCFGPESVPFIAKLTGSLLGGGTIVLTIFLFRYLFPLNNKHHLLSQLVWAGSLMSAGIVAVTPAFALNSTSGLETIMFSFFLVLALILGQIEGDKERWMGSALAFSVVILTRPEGCLLFAVYWSAHFIIAVIKSIKKCPDNNFQSYIKVLYGSNIFRLLMVNLIIVTGIFLCHMVFRLYSYDGEWLPNTFYAKQGGFWGPGAWSYISSGLFPSVFGLIGLSLSLLGYCLNRSRVLPGLLPFAAITLLGSCLPFIVGTDWMLGSRFVIPHLPMVAVITVGGWLGLLLKFSKIRVWVVFVALIASLAILWVKHDKYRQSLYDHTHLRSRGYQTGHTALANWLKVEANKGNTIALMDIGIVGYLCIDQSILDLTGLTDRYIAKSEGTFLKKHYDANYIFERRPDFIVLTLTAPGRSYHVPPEGIRFNYWTSMEAALVRTQEFQRSYIKKTDVISSNNWLDSLANRIGAAKIFEHAHPGRYYLLAVFRRSAT